LTAGDDKPPGLLFDGKLDRFAPQELPNLIARLDLEPSILLVRMIGLEPTSRCAASKPVSILVTS
jgi:hypothetical protein